MITHQALPKVTPAGMAVGVSRCPHLLFFVTISILSKYLEECFTSLWAPATVKLAQSHRHIHYYTEMNPWQKILKCQLDPNLVRAHLRPGIKRSNVFIPFPTQSPSHSLRKSENHDELFRPVEIAKKNQQFERFVKYLESPVCPLRVRLAANVHNPTCPAYKWS